MIDRILSIHEDNKFFVFPKDQDGIYPIDVNKLVDIAQTEYLEILDDLDLSFMHMHEFLPKPDFVDNLPYYVEELSNSNKRLKALDHSFIIALHFMCAGYIINKDVTRTGIGLSPKTYFDMFHKQVSMQYVHYRSLDIITWMNRFNIITEHIFPEIEIFPEIREDINYSKITLENAIEFSLYAHNAKIHSLQ